MARYKTLSPIDVFLHRKDLLWGKSYFAALEWNKIKSYLIFSNLYARSELKIIEHLDANKVDLVKAFTKAYAKRTKYFLAELDEIEQSHHIQTLHATGFKILKRVHCFDFKTHEANGPCKQLVCREAESKDLKQMQKIEASAQRLEYRDELFKSIDFIHNNLTDFYIFSKTDSSDEVVGFCHRKNPNQKHCFEFTFHSGQSNLMASAINTFYDYYCGFEMNPVFRFIITEDHKALVEEFTKKHHLSASFQRLILEGSPRIKNRRFNLSYWANKVGARMTNV